MKTKVINKGFTITVVSWENDGDSDATNSITVLDLEEARKINKICKELFKSYNDEEGGIGNSMDGEADDVIADYIEDNPELNLSVDYINNIASDLMGGGSDCYDYRVCESVKITYSPEDIYLEEIIF